MRYLAAEGTANPIMPIWQELVVGLVAFGILVFVLIKYVFPRMEQTFQARVDAIEGGLKKAELAQAEANQLLEQYRAQLADARTEASRIRDEARADAVALLEELLAAGRDERDRIIASGRDQLAAERQSIVRELRQDIVDLAVELASRIVGEALADDVRRRDTVDRFLSEMEAAGTAGGTR